MSVSSSAEGGRVAFLSSFSNLVDGDTNGASFGGTLSADGRCVAFSSYASNLVEDDTHDAQDVFVNDLSTGVTRRVSASTSGVSGNADSFAAGITNDGRFVTFGSSASNLVDGDTNETNDVFIHDRSTGETYRVSLREDGSETLAQPRDHRISHDGTRVLFVTEDPILDEDKNELKDLHAVPNALSR